MGLGDMTPPPLNPKDISVVPLAELLSHTKEGGAAPTSMDEMNAYHDTINTLLTRCNLTKYLTRFPKDSLTQTQYSRLGRILVGKTPSDHYWLLKFVPFNECLREFLGPCLATICEERTMVLKHVMMHVTEDGKLGVLDPFKPQIAMAAKEKKQVFIKQQVISDITQDTFDTIDGDTSGMVNTNVEWLQDNMNRVEYEPRKSKKAKKTEKGLDKFTK